MPSLAFTLESASRPPKWEAGAGLGYIGFEQYPASDQRTDLAFPFPTFQYRGNILRADEREGANLFLLKKPGWSIQMGGVGFPPLNSSTNQARSGMDDLPLLAALGPQVQKRLNEELTLKFGVYQAIAATWLNAHPSGMIWEADGTLRTSTDIRGRNAWGADEIAISVSANIMGASQEVHELYFGVPAEKMTGTRPAFHASAGILQSQISVFETIKSGNFAFYFGARVSDYRFSANRDSPLHRSDQSIAGLIGLTYTMFRSSAPAVSYEDASGLVGKLRERNAK